MKSLPHKPGDLLAPYSTTGNLLLLALAGEVGMWGTAVWRQSSHHLSRRRVYWEPWAGNCMMNAIDELPRLAIHIRTWVMWLVTQREALPGLGVIHGVRRGSAPRLRSAASLPTWCGPQRGCTTVSRSYEWPASGWQTAVGYRAPVSLQILRWCRWQY